MELELRNYHRLIKNARKNNIAIRAKLFVRLGAGPSDATLRTNNVPYTRPISI